jgi:hypothetical protein
MSSPQPLPSLFGRFTAIFQDHDSLGKTMRRLRFMCAALEPAREPLALELSPAALLSEFRAALAEHFAAEESEQYFGTVVDEAPDLGPQIDRLKAEHVMMLEAAKLLSDLARDQSRWAQLPAPTRELVAQLERHERAESTLLRELFSPKH